MLETFRNIDKNVSTMLVLRKITRGNPMKKLFIGFLKWLMNSLEEEKEAIFQPEPQQESTTKWDIIQ